MNAAIVCDDLIQHGGAEKIVEAISDLYPDAPIYTTVASTEWLDFFRKKGRRVRTSFLQKFPFAEKLNRYYSVFYYHVLAIESFDFSEYELLISVSSRYAHFALTKPGTKHLCYLNTPGRMFWETTGYFKNETFGVPKFLRGLGKIILTPFLSYMRLADFSAMHRIDRIISNSKVTQERLYKYFKLKSQIIHPFVNYHEPVKPSRKEDFYLILGRLVSWKKIEIAIEACERMGRKLIIAGEGADEYRLEDLAGSRTVFMGRVDESKKWELLSSCRGLIFPQKEDFGIVPLEAMSCGTPVIAFKDGGALETVAENVTGIFFDEQTSESLNDALDRFEKMTFAPDSCIKQSEKFSLEKFKYSILKEVDDLTCTKS